MEKFIVLKYSLSSHLWELIAGYDCIIKAFTFYDRQLSYHPTSQFMIATVIVESKH